MTDGEYWVCPECGYEWSDPKDEWIKSESCELCTPTLFRKEKLARELVMLESGSDDDEETTLFVLWAVQTSRTTQDMVSTFMGWCAHHEYTCHDDLPEEMQRYEGGI